MANMQSNDQTKRNSALDRLYGKPQIKSVAGNEVGYQLVRNTNLELQYLTVVDGQIVIRPQVNYQSTQGKIVETAAGDPGIKYNVVAGSAVLEKDPYNGNIIVSPRGTATTVIRPSLETNWAGRDIEIVGEDFRVGIETSYISRMESQFDQAGGGACAAQYRMAGSTLDFKLMVRAFMPSAVIPLTLTDRIINWRLGMYFAWHPQLGNMRIRYNPAYENITTLKSLSSAEKVLNEGFFPAAGQNQLYFIIDMIDMGITLFNKEPMIQTYEYTDWPPYSTVLAMDASSLDFFDVNHPDRVMLTITKNDMQIYDYQAIKVECIEFDIDDEGLCTSCWRFENESKDVVQGRWFALGDFTEVKGSPTWGSRLLTPAGTPYSEFQVVLKSRVHPSILRQTIGMYMVSVNDPIIAGKAVREFQFPD